MQTFTMQYTVPQWTVPYLANADATGLTDDEHQAAQRFESGVSELAMGGHWHWNFGGDDVEAYFSRYNDVDEQGGDVVDITAVIELVDAPGAATVDIPYGAGVIPAGAELCGKCAAWERQHGHAVTPKTVSECAMGPECWSKQEQG